MIGARIARARSAAGLSMRELAARVGVSAAMIDKYEHDRSMPPSGKLAALASALGVRSEYFFRPTEVRLEGVEYRKRASAPAKLLRRIEADVLDQAERWEELANLWPQFPIAPFELPAGLPDRIDALDGIEPVADAVRSAWQLGLDPVPDLIDLLESHGILVILTDTDETRALDGLQATVAGRPVIVVSTHIPGDRQRLTLAHELGHLVLHGRLADGVDEEKACHRFAAAFLLPASALRAQLGEVRHGIEVRELYLLKHEFGLSMQACLYRARDLGVIGTELCQRMFRVFSAQGWRRQEPGEALPQERTARFEQLVYRALGEGLIGDSKAAELLGLSAMAFHRARKLALKNEPARQ